MCPAWIATMALMVAGGTSAGGLTALVVKKLRATSGAKGPDPTTRTRARDKQENGHAA
jgi:hypothetical protein